MMWPYQELGPTFGLYEKHLTQTRQFASVELNETTTQKKLNYQLSSISLPMFLIQEVPIPNSLRKRIQYSEFPKLTHTNCYEYFKKWGIKRQCCKSLPFLLSLSASNAGSFKRLGLPKWTSYRCLIDLGSFPNMLYCSGEVMTPHGRILNILLNIKRKCHKDMECK